MDIGYCTSPRTNKYSSVPNERNTHAATLSPSAYLGETRVSNPLKVSPPHPTPPLSARSRARAVSACRRRLDGAPVDPLNPLLNSIFSLVWLGEGHAERARILVLAVREVL